MHTVNFIIRVIEHHQVLVYVVIYIGMIFEGEFFLISTGILTHLGALNFWFALLFVLLGAFSKTLIGYALGGFLSRKFSHHRFFKYIQKRVYAVLPRFKLKPFWSIFVSKFIIGSNHVVIIFSGYEKIDYKKYLKAEISSTVIWAPLLLSLGYLFSYTALNVSREIWKFLAVVFILFIIFILFDKLVSWIYELFEEFYDEKSE
jgi:membrane-associated protein